MSDGHGTNCGGVGSFRVRGYTDPERGDDCEHDECYDCRGTGWEECDVCEERHDPAEGSSACACCGELVTCSSLEPDAENGLVCEDCAHPADLPENDTYWVTR